ncbi:MAG: DUF177 domain-containing protein [Deltaproteobacteria bacterium]|nr:DUF177 domain-containing protein [Deltaproteobacteria bacterium]
MYWINVDEIPEEGFIIDAATPDDAWVGEAVGAALHEKWRPDDGARVHLTLVRSGDQISMVGGVYCTMHPVCDRCAKPFAFQQQVSLHILFTPRAGGAEQERIDRAGVEVRLDEDQDVSFYAGRQLDIPATITEQIVLAQPMQYLCAPKCPGLCPRCGKDLNRGPCGCPAPAKRSPFAILKDARYSAKGRGAKRKSHKEGV